MKIVSWNVNGIRAVAKKGFFEFVDEYSPDIMCIQETKAFEEQFLKEVGLLMGYQYIWHSGEKPGYSGTAIFYKNGIKVLDSKNHFDEITHFHADGRVTQIECEKEGKNIVLFNGYFPNGGERADGTQMLGYKLDFYDALIAYTQTLKKSGKNIILTGDFNICHEEIDIARPKENENSIGFLPVERAKVSELLKSGFIDTFRHFYPHKTDVYSWWSYRAGARPRNVGWRLDYFMVNPELLENVKNISYLTQIEGSDHCPIMLDIF